MDIGLATPTQSVLTRLKRMRLIVDRDDRHIGALSASIRSRETGAQAEFVTPASVNGQKLPHPPSGWQASRARLQRIVRFSRCEFGDSGLQAVQPVIETALREQRAMRSAFADLPMMQHEDLV